MIPEEGTYLSMGAEVKLEWTGEFYVPGKTPKRIADDHEARYAFASKYVVRKRVLDIACGVGYGVQRLQQAGASSVKGVDISRDLIQYAKTAYCGEDVEFEVGDICSFGEGRFDVVTCFETIEHVHDHMAALRNLHRVIDEGGVLIISSPNRAITSPGARSMLCTPRNPFHRHEFTIGELASELMRCGFLVSKREIYGQRQRCILRSTLLNRLLVPLFDPDEESDPSVSPLRRWHLPRYFVIVANRLPLRYTHSQCSETIF